MYECDDGQMQSLRCAVRAWRVGYCRTYVDVRIDRYVREMNDVVALLVFLFPLIATGRSTFKTRDLLPCWLDKVNELAPLVRRISPITNTAPIDLAVC